MAEVEAGHEPWTVEFAVEVTPWTPEPDREAHDAALGGVGGGGGEGAEGGHDQAVAGRDHVAGAGRAAVAARATTRPAEAGPGARR